MYHFDSYDASLVIDGFDKGISESPYSGISDIRNVNITSIPGEASVNFAITPIQLASVSGTLVSMNSSNNQLTLSGVVGSVVLGQTIRFSGLAGGHGIENATNYWIVGVFSPTVIVVNSSPIFNATVTITATDSGTFSSTGVLTKPMARTYDSRTNTYYILDSSGHAFFMNINTANGAPVWIGNDSFNGSQDQGQGNGLIVYSDRSASPISYLFIFRNHNIDYCKLSDYTFVYGWQVMNTPNVPGVFASHFALQSYNDSKIYYVDANHVGTFYQNQSSTTFDPSDSSTYTWTKSILDLPTNDTAQSLAELGPNLLVGGSLNAIYPWDRIVRTAGSAGNLSVLSFYSTPILVAENFIYRMVTVNTNTYIFAGIRGRIYVTNGSQASFFKKVPDHISGTVEPYFKWGDANAIKNQLFFGVLCTTNAGGSNSQFGGVWGIDLDSLALRLSHKLSYGTYAGIASLILPIAIINNTTTPAGTGLYVGWDSGISTYGIDITTTSPYTTSVATIDSDLIPIGTFNKPRDLTQVEYRLSRPMVSGESIIIKTRLIFNTTDTGYTATLTDSTVGHWSGTSPVNFKKAQWVQFQVLLNSTVSSPSYVRLREIRVMGLTGPTPQGAQQLSL